MSSRYTLFTISDLPKRFGLDSPVPAELKRSYNISPTQLAPVIIVRDGKPTLETMKWGLVPQGAKDTNSVFRYKTFDTKSEGIFSKNSTNLAIRNNRCIIPANGYYEWRTTSDGKKPYYIHAPDQPLLGFAGIYSSWQDPSGQQWGTYSIVTCEANNDVERIGSRMPVILQAEEETRWLNELDSISPLYEMMRPPLDGSLVSTEVGAEINSIKINNPGLITPL